MKFSEHFGVTRGPADNWLDPHLDNDTLFALDPYLAFDDASSDAQWSSLRTQTFDFFRTAYRLAIRSRRIGGDRNPATRFLMAEEPREVCLGVTMRGTAGRGIGVELATKMREALEILGEVDQEVPVEHIEVFSLFVPNLGKDLISDLFVNINKAALIAYTQDIARRHGVPMVPIEVPNARWVQPGRWISGVVDLPLNPHASSSARNVGVVLMPSSWVVKLRDPRNEIFGSWFQDSEEGADLRTLLNLDSFDELGTQEMQDFTRRIVRVNPEVAFAWARQAGRGRVPYDVENDPDYLINYEKSYNHLLSVTNFSVLEDPGSDLCAWVKAMVENYRHAVEEQEGWKAFWQTTRGRHVIEPVTQVIAAPVFRAHCEHKNVKMYREVDLGRGVVDFVFNGNQTEVLIEVKHMDNDKLVSGASHQLPQYMRSAKAKCGYLLCIGFEDKHFSSRKGSKRRKVEEACENARKDGLNINPLFIDARRKTSASKL